MDALLTLLTTSMTTGETPSSLTALLSGNFSKEELVAVGSPEWSLVALEAVDAVEVCSLGLKTGNECFECVRGSVGE